MGEKPGYDVLESKNNYLEEFLNECMRFNQGLKRKANEHTEMACFLVLLDMAPVFLS